MAQGPALPRSLPLLVVALLSAGGALLTLATPRSAGSAPPRTAPVVPSEGFLLYDVRDGGSGAPIPCKLTFLGTSGTATPAFTRFDIGRQEGDAVLAWNRVMSATGQGVAHVPTGSYDVYVSRGPEWDLFVARGLRITPGGAVRLTARLHHVVDTAGWVSADFHVHAHMSSDSHVPMHDRIYEFLSDGVEVITSTDHNVLADYAPLIAELGVADQLGSIVGDEITTGGWGHFGAFPLPVDPGRAGLGAVLVHGRTAADFFADVRRNAPGALIDVHHPCIDKEIGYFSMSGLDTAADRCDRPGFSWDFDALEVLNGYQDPERTHINHLVTDWFNLLSHGHVVTATGNSDTHHLDHNIGGYPRNWVRVPDDRPAAARPEVIAAAVKAHHSQLSTAPFLLLRAGKAEIGDLVDGRAGSVHLEVEVRAAPWVSLSTVSVVQSGTEVKRWPVPPSPPAGPGGSRFRASLDLPVRADGWLVVRADGDVPLAPVVGDLSRFDVRPFALTNPIFVDFDGNGRYDAPPSPPLRKPAPPPAPSPPPPPPRPRGAGR